MQRELFETLSSAYAEHVNEAIQALDLTQGLDGIVDISIDTRRQCVEFFERYDEAERDFQKLNLDRVKMAHLRDDGFRVGRLHGDKSECPYLPMSVEYLFWYKGWCQARNVFPVTEIPMKDVFELDRPVTRFKAKFRIDELIERCAERICRTERPEIAWSSMSPLSRKPYLVKAVSFLEALQDPPSLSLPPPSESTGVTGSLPVASN